jgi:hypothetical protein
MKYSHGRPGTQIQGSRYVRDYCRGCGEPIRVSYVGRTGCHREFRDRMNFCEHCDPMPSTIRCEKQSQDWQAANTWDNTVRAWEDRNQ